MIYLGKTSTELSDNDFSELTILFNHVYNRNISVSTLRYKYASPYLGYSFHGLMYSDEGKIVGALTFIPILFQFFENTIVAGSAADLMIHENFRKDLLSFKRLYESALEKAGSLFDFLYAVPNSNAYLYWTKMLKWRDLGKIHYFIQILNISGIRKELRALDPLSRLIAKAANLLVKIDFAAEKAHAASIMKINNEDFKKYRFGKDYFGEKYNEISSNSNYAYYSLVTEAGARTAYIVDFFPHSRKWMGQVIKSIYCREKNNIDIILYIGNNFMTPLNMLRVPQKFEPRTLNLIGKIVSDKIDNRIFNLDCWQFNLSDFDVR